MKKDVIKCAKAVLGIAGVMIGIMTAFTIIALWVKYVLVPIVSK